MVAMIWYYVDGVHVAKVMFVCLIVVEISLNTKIMQTRDIRD